MSNAIEHITGKPVRYLFRRAGAEIVYDRLVAPYFAQKVPQLALVGVAAISAVNIFGSTQIINISGEMLSHLSSKNFSAYIYDMEKFTGLAMGMMATSSIQSRISQKLRLSWGAWAKSSAVKEWLSTENRHKLVTSFVDKQPEQRIGSDVDVLVNLSEPLTIGALTSAGRVGAFSYMLYHLSPTLFAGTAVLCAAGTLLVSKAGKRLTPLNTELSNRLGAYRTSIVRTNAHAESVAFYGGQEAESAVLHKRLVAVNAATDRKIKTNIFLQLVESTFENISYVFPNAVIAPDYFRAGSNFDLGKAGQSISAFHNLRFSFNWYGQNISTLSEWKACAKRLAEFLKICETPIAEHEKVPAYVNAPHTSLAVDRLKLEVKQQDGGVINKLVSLNLESGDRLVLVGPSGCGKTTLLRVLAGVLPYKDGEITYSSVGKSSGDVIFVPQDAYIPDMPLREVLSYPSTGIEFTDREMAQALKRVGLEHVIPMLSDDTTTGSEFKLSGGERQRLSFARLLLHKPAVVALDEVTSNLPDHDGVGLYGILFCELPDSIIISVSHRPCLVPLHGSEGRFVGDQFIQQTLEQSTSQVIHSPYAHLNGATSYVRPSGGMRGAPFGPHLSKA
jgi:putative ATP-binding cassette transporter